MGGCKFERYSNAFDGGLMELGTEDCLVMLKQVIFP